MTANTSPTPWEACGNVVRDAESIEVCTAAIWRPDNMTANMRLCAAAPDLVVAGACLLVAVTDLLRSLPRDAVFCAERVAELDALELAQRATETAIDKARGVRL